MSSTPELPELRPTPMEPSPATPRTVDPSQPVRTPGSNLPATTPERNSEPQTKPALDRVGMYQVQQELARGGMGVVFKAQHVVLDRVVALKMMRADARLWPQDGQRFEREMRAVARLSHPHILAIYEIGWHEGQPYYTMPYLAGGSLASQRERWRTEPATVASLMVKVARAVQYAHEQGIVHRDLKPGNVLLDERGEPLVTDFGLAKFQDDDVELTQSGTVLGTPSYMAPEQAAGETKRIGPHTDVWALGVMLYELLTGHRPFLGGGTEEVKQQIRTIAPRRPRALHPNLNPALESIVLKCLQKDPARRYATAGALADDLERYLSGQRPLAYGDPWRRRLWQSVRRRWLRSAAVMLGILTAAAIGFLTCFHPTPERVLDPPIVLIEEGKPLGEVRWLIGAKQDAMKGGTPQEPLTLHGDNIGLLELRSAPPWDRYRLEAWIQHKDVTGFDSVGIFFALSRYECANGPYYSYWDLSFAERGRFAGKVGLSASSLQVPFPHAQSASPSFFEQSFHRFGPALPDKNDSPVRKLAVEVDAEEVRAFWEGTCFHTAPREWIEQHSARVVTRLDGVPGRFTPQGGLGIYVHYADVTILQVSLSPLP